jgi:hypothetical protein
MTTFSGRLWVCSNCGFAAAERRMVKEVAAQSLGAKTIFASLRGLTKIARSGRPDLHFYVDPHLAEKYDINVHLADDAEPAPSSMTVAASNKGIASDFQETNVPFPSALKNEPNYLCTVVFQKPDEDVYAISAYLVETYLGRYAWKSNYYFRKESRNSAVRCFNRVLQAVRDVKEDMLEKGSNASETPYRLRRALQGTTGELEPKSNKMATYLDPDNVPLKEAEPPRPVYVPKSRSVKSQLS